MNTSLHSLTSMSVLLIVEQKCTAASHATLWRVTVSMLTEQTDRQTHARPSNYVRSGQHNKRQWDWLVRFARNECGESGNSAVSASVRVRPFPLVVHTGAAVTTAGPTRAYPESDTIQQLVCIHRHDTADTATQCWPQPISQRTELSPNDRRYELEKHSTHKSAKKPTLALYFCASWPWPLIFWSKNKWVFGTHGETLVCKD